MSTTSYWFLWDFTCHLSIDNDCTETMPGRGLLYEYFPSTIKLNSLISSYQVLTPSFTFQVKNVSLRIRFESKAIVMCYIHYSHIGYINSCYQFLAIVQFQSIQY